MSRGLLASGEKKGKKEGKRRIQTRKKMAIVN